MRFASFLHSRLYQWLSTAALYAVGGSLARCYWSGEEAISELEILVWAPFGKEQSLIDALADAGFPESCARLRQYRQTVLRFEDLAVRMIACALPYEAVMLERARPDPASGLRLISAEDLLLLTLFRYRPEAREQALSLLLAQRGRLQWPYIEHWLPQLVELKEDPRPLKALAELRETVARI
jgi:hypothetical protein